MKPHLRVAVGLLATVTLAPVVAVGQPVATSADPRKRGVGGVLGVGGSRRCPRATPSSATSPTPAERS